VPWSPAYERSSKPPREPAQLARLIVDVATGGIGDRESPHEPEKCPAVVALGRLGGLKGVKRFRRNDAPRLPTELVGTAEVLS
jgi:hypothetical protein